MAPSRTGFSLSGFALLQENVKLPQEKFMLLQTKSDRLKPVLLAFVKRHRNDPRGRLIRADADGDFCSGRFGGNWHIRHPNVLLQKRRGRAAGYPTGRRAANRNGAGVARDQAILHLESHERSIDPLFFLTDQDVAAEEFSLGRFANPAQPRLPRRRCLINFMSVKAHGGFEAQRVARAQAARQHSFRGARIQYRVPQLSRSVPEKSKFRSRLPPYTRFVR